MSNTAPEKAGPPAPGKTEAGPFGSAKWAVVNVEDTQADTAWARLTKALGTNLQRGIYRAHHAQRRMNRGV